MTRVTDELVALVERTVAGLGYDLVDLERVGHGLLRVTLDTVRPGGIGLEDCEKVSRQLTHLFAVEHVEYDRLSLEVGSGLIADHRDAVGTAELSRSRPTHTHGAHKRARLRIMHKQAVAVAAGGDDDRAGRGPGHHRREGTVR